MGELERTMLYRELLEWHVVFKMEEEAHEAALRKSKSERR